MLRSVFTIRLVLLTALATAIAGVLLASPVEARGVPAIQSHPRIPAAPVTSAGWTSANWSGYALTNGPYTAITGTWKVPSVSRKGSFTFSATWIGIDGFKPGDDNLIQTGTESDYYNGSAHYDAWIEVLPAQTSEQMVMSVNPGDTMTADIHQLSTGSWSMTITDTSTPATFHTTVNYNAPLSSAEWIVEAPTVNGTIATLAHYQSPLTIDPGTVNGGNPRLTLAGRGVMIQHGSHVSTPSNPDADTDGFNSAYGSHKPAPPAS